MIERPRGTRDFQPDEMESRRRLEDQLRKKAEHFGYREILTPTFEHTELFLEKSGPSIVEEIYSFEDKGGRGLALRPEFTASVMRMYSESLKGDPKPLKLFYFGPAYRYERPQSGRYREFWQFGTELIGADTARADAENIALAYDCIKKLGIEDAVEMKISNLKILGNHLKSKGLSSEEIEELYHVIDKGDETEELLDRFGLEEEFIELLDAPFQEIPEYIEDTQHYRYLEDVIDCLSYYGIEKEDLFVDLRTVRGLDYYTGVVFEIDAKKLGAQKQICGGGDYNLGDIFGTEISSKGFSFGFDRLLLAMEKEGKAFQKKRVGCYLIPIGEEAIPYVYEVLSMLRKNGIRSDIDLKNRSVGKALGFADKADFKYSLIIGEEEVKNEVVALKDMESGDQKEVKKEEITEEV